jgi:hypothetical protein
MPAYPTLKLPRRESDVALPSEVRDDLSLGESVERLDVILEPHFDFLRAEQTLTRHVILRLAGGKAPTATVLVQDVAD